MKKLYSRVSACQEPDEELTFPCLMESKSYKGSIYLMYSKGKGTRIASVSDERPVGVTLTGFTERQLTPYHGTVTLSME